MKKRHAPHHRAIPFAQLATMLLLLAAIALSLIFSGVPFVSSELQFDDRSPSGLYIIPASGESDPHPPAQPVMNAVACNANATVTLSWGTSVDATSYPVRYSAPSMASCPAGWWMPAAGECALDGSAVTSVTVPITYGTSYLWWVHAHNAYGWSAITQVSFSCAAPVINCTAPWGASVSHGSGVTAYLTSSVAYGSSCTSQTRTCTSGTLSGTYQYQTCAPAQPSNCTINGTTVNHGSSIQLYQSQTVPYGSGCPLEWRTCNNGTLSGSYQYGSCIPAEPSSCTAPWGASVSHTGSVTAYLTSSVAYGSTCTSQSRVCTNGSLSGSYTNQTCAPLPGANCTFNGQTILHTAATTTYQAATVPYGSSCASQTRTCTNGTLSGTYAYGACTVLPGNNCTFNGQTILHNAATTTYQAATVAYPSSCSSQSRTCTNGTLSGSYAYGACSVTAPSVPTATISASAPSIVVGQSSTLNATFAAGSGDTLLNDNIDSPPGTGWGATTNPDATKSYVFTPASAGTYTFYARSRTSYYPTWTTYASATVTVSNPSNCTAPWGASVSHGSSVTGYLASSVAYPSACTSQTRTCSNGTLSGSYTYGTCSVTPPGTPIVSISASAPSIVVGQSSTINATFAARSGDTLLNDNIDSPVGTGLGATSNPDATKSYVFTPSSAGTYTFYGRARTSYYSSWTTYASATVTVSNPSSCTFNGSSVAHNASVTAYLTSSVAYGSSCSSQTRTCSNGTLSGTYTYAACVPDNPSNCTFNGSPVTHGNAVTAYLTSSVAYPSACTSQTRTCSNGSLSGTYTHASCSVTAPNAPSATITASSTSITVGQTTGLRATFAAGSGDSLTFDNIDSPVGTGLGATTNPDAVKYITFAPVSAGSYVFYARARTSYFTSWTTYASVTVTVANAAPSCTLTPTPSSIVRGNTASLAWSSSYATSGSINQGIGTVGTSGSTGVQPLTTTTYTGTFTGPGGSAQCTATITVSCAISYSCSGASVVTTNTNCSTTTAPACAAPSFCSVGQQSCQWPEIEVVSELTAIPEIVRPGDATRLYWTVEDAESCSVSGGGQTWNTLSSGAGGQQTLGINQRTRYTLSCQGLGSNPDWSEYVDVLTVPEFQET